MSIYFYGNARLTRDSELKYTNGGMAVLHFGIASDDRVKEGDVWVKKPSFWDVELWGKQAESLAQYLTKGKLIFLCGKAKKNYWEKDGVKHEKTVLTATDIDPFLVSDKKPEGEKRVQVDANNPTPSNEFSDTIPF